jgi:DNA-binding beta-propeller fold protein YncE
LGRKELKTVIFEENISPFAVVVQDNTAFVSNSYPTGASVYSVDFSSDVVTPIGALQDFRGGGVVSVSDGSCGVVDTLGNCVKLLWPSTDNVSVFGTFGTGPGEFKHPCSIAVAGNGTIYVTDSGNCRVQIFDKRMRFLSEFGVNGWGVGEFRCPMYIAVTLDGMRIFVSDRLHRNVQEFNKSGQYIRTVGWFGPQTPLAVGPDGSLYVATTDGSVNRYTISWYLLCSNFMWQQPTDLWTDILFHDIEWNGLLFHVQHYLAHGDRDT